MLVSAPRIRPITDPSERRVIAYFREASKNMFSQGDIPISVRILSQDLGMRPERINALCRALTDRGHLRSVEAGGQYPFYLYVPRR